MNVGRWQIIWWGRPAGWKQLVDPKWLGPWGPTGGSAIYSHRVLIGPIEVRRFTRP